MSPELLLMSLFIIKHYICDFPLQTYWMAMNKGTYGHKGGLAHAGIQVLGTFVIFIVFCQYSGIFFTPTVFLGAIIIEGVIHYHIDWFKMWLNNKFEWKPESSSEFWILLGFDQLLHYLTYVGMIWYML